MDVRRLRMENVQLRETTAIYELSLAVSFTLDVSTILNKVADAALEQCQADETSIMPLTEDRKALYVAVACGLDRRHILGTRVPADQGIAGWVARSREPLLLQGQVSDPRFAPVWPRADIRSALSIPVMAGGEALGVLNVNAVRRRPFTPGDLRSLSILASIAGSALENARLHEALKQEALQLEAKVGDRTRELQAANAQLQEAMRLVQEASRHKSEFLANMSHELRTPLNSILGFSQLLLEQTPGLLSEKQLRFLTNVHNSGQHLLQLISDILDISKVEAGKFVLQPEALPVAETLEDILVIGRGLAHKKAQTVEARIAPDLPPLHGDPVRFKQILFNLLSNAVKFTPEQGTVTVTARRASARTGEPESRGNGEVPAPIPRVSDSPIRGETDFLEIKVQDTGVGIRAEDLPRLFKEFVQLETTQAQKHEGTGLGLALTKKLVEQHGGRIWAESEGEGQGSTFTALLPFAGPQA
jgi:signal transduction histidine kinase